MTELLAVVILAALAILSLAVNNWFTGRSFVRVQAQSQEIARQAMVLTNSFGNKLMAKDAPVQFAPYAGHRAQLDNQPALHNHAESNGTVSPGAAARAMSVEAQRVVAETLAAREKRKNTARATDIETTDDFEAQDEEGMR